MSMVCREVVEVLIDYVDGEMTIEHRAQFERHLCGCLQCFAYLETYRATIRLTRALPKNDPLPAAFAERLQRMLAEEPTNDSTP
jgi:anti-sigma factor RsiW